MSNTNQVNNCFRKNIQKLSLKDFHIWTHMREDTDLK